MDRFSRNIKKLVFLIRMRFILTSQKVLAKIFSRKCNFDVIDLFEKVTDKDAALMTRDIARKEGIFVGNSAGSAIGGFNSVER